MGGGGVGGGTAAGGGVVTQANVVKIKALHRTERTVAVRATPTSCRALRPSTGPCRARRLASVMRTPTRWLVLPLALLFALPAFAQDDDDLAPLTPKKKPPAVAPKPKPKPAPKPAPKPVAKPAPDDDDLTPIAALKGDVTVKVPAGLTNAVLNIDGKDVGPLPAGPQPLTAGEHTIKVHRVGYADFVKKVNVVGGKPIDLDAKLAPLSAVVSVTSDVPDAQVFINGRLIGTAPITEYEAPPGTVELSVRKDGFKDDKQRLTLVAGKDYPVSVRFNPGTTTVVAAAVDRPVEPRLTPDDTVNPVSGGVTTTADAPITSKWYFWAGVAAVVAAGVGITVAATQSQQQTKSLDERTLCAGGQGGKCDICVNLQCNAAGLPSGLLNF